MEVIIQRTDPPALHNHLSSEQLREPYPRSVLQ